jgi:peptidoglycan hydrolase-like protein with peptidoglycan-binding domain
LKAEADAKAAAAKAEAEAKTAAKADAEAKAAAAKQNIVVASAPPSAPVEPAKPAIDVSQTVRQLQAELRRVGCYPGAVNGDWNNDSRKAMELFNKHAGMRLDVKVASLDVVDVVKGKGTRICPLQCERGYKADSESCVKITCPAGQSVGDDNTCEKPKEKARSAARPEAGRAADDKPASKGAGGGAAGQVVCGKNGCVEVKAGCRASSNASQNGVSQNPTVSVTCN